LDEETQLQVNV